MTSDADFDVDDDETADEPSGNAALRKKLSEANRQVREATERAQANEAAARRVAFMDAGIPDNPQSRYFQQTYDGALEADAIKTAAQAHGFMAAEEAQTNAEVEQIDSMSRATQGAEPAEQAGSTEAIDREMREAAETAVREGRDVGEAIARVQMAHGRPTTFETR